MRIGMGIGLGIIQSSGDLGTLLRGFGSATVLLGGVGVVGGATVTTWTDPATGVVYTWNGAKPDVISGGLNGLDTIRFNGTTQELISTTTPAVAHAFFVLKHVADANGPWFATGSATDYMTCWQLTNVQGINRHVGSSGVGYGQHSTTFHDTAWHVFDMNGFALANSGNCIRIGNVSEDSGTDGTGGYGLGAARSGIGSNADGSFGNVEIAAIVLYSAELASGARDSVYALLKNAFAL